METTGRDEGTYLHGPLLKLERGQERLVVGYFGIELHHVLQFVDVFGCLFEVDPARFQEDFPLRRKALFFRG